jgi:hypothetical protein
VARISPAASPCIPIRVIRTDVYGIDPIKTELTILVYIEELN